MSYVTYDEKRERYLLVFLFGLIISFLFSGFLPSLREFLRLKQKLYHIHLINEQQELQEKYLQLKEEKDLKENKLKSLEDKLNWVSESHKIMTKVNKIIEFSGVDLEKCSTNPINFSGLYPDQKIFITIVGEHYHILTFLFLFNQNFLYKEISFTITPNRTYLACLIEVDLYLKG